MASYPSGIVSTAVFTTKSNTLDVIDASHPNLIQEEIIAIETALGTNPAQSSSGSGTYVSAATPFGTVAARLNNHEIGIIGDVHTQYVKNSLVTTAGDLLVGSGSGTLARLGIGASGTVLTSNGTTAAWSTPASGISQTNGTVTTASTSLGVLRNVWVNTAAPTSGNGIDGDIWVQYV